ncbi:MAG TPA: DUF883 family protein [Usitatibacter sp.]|nr:DUF883 family protein [Usitatibacter sp.]
MSEVQAARDKLIEDFNAIIADSEQLLKAAAAVGGEKAQGIRADLESRIQDARERVARMQDAATEQARRVVKQTDEYVHENPWQSIAVAAGVAAAVGLVLGLVLNRR